ncbi:MAG: hypothetical protein ACJA2N_001529 [Salibacteraceae bacterium]
MQPESHLDRLHGAEAFTQAGEIDRCFGQLDLLNIFLVWKGSEVFKESKWLIPFHSDDRWNLLMMAFDLNN